MIITVRLRLKDKHAAVLNQQAKAVSLVWNYCNEMQQKAVQWDRKWLSYGQLCRLTAASSTLLGLQAQSIQKVCEKYVFNRRLRNKQWLRFRGQKSLGWVPFNQQSITWKTGAFHFAGCRYQPMHLHPALTKDAHLLSGNFSQDRGGRWYINVPIEVGMADRAPNTRVGIDLGLKTLAVLSNGEQAATPSFYRINEHAIIRVQQARKTKRERAIHRKVAERRRDYLHKASARIAGSFGFIVVGAADPVQLMQTTRAKSVGDAGWSAFKAMLSYKSIRNGGSMIEVNEKWTTQTCSSCGVLPEGRPSGIAGLGIREWTCGGCGATHDRDVNAARNILARGLASLAEGAAKKRSSHAEKALSACVGNRTEQKCHRQRPAQAPR